MITWRTTFSRRTLLVTAAGLLAATVSTAQTPGYDESEFGPVVRAYLGYLRNEQEVVDDRASRHEVNRAYYLRNSNRIKALRQMAIRIARETNNDYLPELEAVTRDELGTLFEQVPRVSSLQPGQVLNDTFRFLGVVRYRELFYVFARLDIYEQAELRESRRQSDSEGPAGQKEAGGNRATTRARRVIPP